ncbi:MAG TPA: DUF4301 family protein [Thermoanaerobaculia bacterium]|nr:DUF4301 family protein [Thermoanaerobaculia bacterium]
MLEESEDLFSPADFRQMAELGIEPAEALRQIELFRSQPPFARVLHPCRVGDGIRTISKFSEPWLLARFEEAARHGRIAKFVPASGAATRMFQDLPQTVLDQLPPMDAGLPKALIPFHQYPQESRTAFEEHLVEAADYTRDANGDCRLHFTVSPQHQDRFEELLERVRPRYEPRHQCRFLVTFSHQHRSTDVIAVDPENRPFRQADGSLLFRPGGHGSLLENLGALGALGWDLVFLKNVDNVVPDSRKPLVNGWKKALAGYLLALQERIFRLLERLESEPEEALLEEAARFAEDELSRPTEASGPPPARRQRLIEALNRPLRVCGMVRNQGEPGGGPFWVEDGEGRLSLQIVESAQIDPKVRAEVLAASTHFNPTDLVCALRDRHGAPYDLQRFVDPAAVFIADKSHEGRPLKALERPGLWNGSMARWNTVFVEVPDETFAPVKTLADLLRPEHQA